MTAREILCIFSGGLDVSGFETTDRRLIAAEEWARALLTIRGTCPWDPALGLGLSLLLNADLAKADLDRIAVDARSEGMRLGILIDAKATSFYGNGQLRLSCEGSTSEGKFLFNLGPGDAREVVLL